MVITTMWNKPQTYNHPKQIPDWRRIDNFIPLVCPMNLLVLDFQIDYNGPVWQTYLTRIQILYKGNFWSTWSIDCGTLTPASGVPKHLYNSKTYCKFLFDGATSTYRPQEYQYGEGITDKDQVLDGIQQYIANMGISSLIRINLRYGTTPGIYTTNIGNPGQSMSEWFEDQFKQYLDNGHASYYYEIDFEEYYLSERLYVDDSETQPTLNEYTPEEHQPPEVEEEVESPEWFPGAFPETPYIHMVFWDGLSYYIPNGMQIHERATRVYWSFGYIAVRAAIDKFGQYAALLPRINVVAYGKWVDMPEPDPRGANFLWEGNIKDKWYAVIKNELDRQTRNLEESKTAWTGLLKNPRIIKNPGQMEDLGAKMEKTDLFNLARLLTGQ